MNGFKKLIAVLLVFILCFSLVGVMAAADATPIVFLETSYADNAATKVRVTIKTSQAYGAISGTLTYPEGLTLITSDSDEENKPVTAEKTLDDDKYTHVGNTIKFVIVTDKLDAGDTYWASFVFNIGAVENLEFNLDASVSNLDATILENETGRKANVMKISTVGSLGGRYRDENDQYANGTAALRFGATLMRDLNAENAIEVAGETGAIKAVSCGAIIGFDFNIRAKNSINATDSIDLKNLVEQQDNKLVQKIAGNGATIHKSTKCFDSADEYLAYTFAITGLVNNYSYNNQEKDLTNEPIVFMPYVIYVREDNTYGVAYGDQISRTYNDVKANYTFSTGNAITE